MRAGIVLLSSCIVLGSTGLELAADVFDAVNDCGELGGDCPPDHDCHDCAHCVHRVAVASGAFVLAAPLPRELGAVARPHADRRPPAPPSHEILVVPRPS